MTFDFTPTQSLGGAVLAIFLLSIAYVFLRGVARMILSIVVLGMSCFVGFRLWQMAPDLSLQWMGKSNSWLVQALPIVGFLITGIVLRKLMGFFKGSSGNAGKGIWPSSLGGLVIRLLLALVPTAGIFILLLIGFHHRGSVDEIRAFSSSKPPSDKTYSQGVKSSIDHYLPAGWLVAIDPLADPARLALAKLISKQAKAPLAPVKDPLTGKFIPRAILVDDPDVQTLAQEGDFGTLLRHPLLTKALSNPSVQSVIKEFTR